MSVNVNGVTGTETVNTVEGKPAVDALITTLTSTTVKTPYGFSAPLYYASKDWMDLTVGQSAPSLVVAGGTTATRAARYGEIALGGSAVYQSMIGQYDFNGLNAVIYLLVDDGNGTSGRPNQAALLSSTYTQMAIA